MPGRGPQPAVADAADAEAVLGDRRQQRDGAAEQHGEHVEGDGAEQHRSAADEAQPLEGVVQRRPLVGRRAVLRPAQRRASSTTMPRRRRSSAAATTYGTVGSTSYRKPLAAGPTIRPNCHVPSTGRSAAAARRSGAISGGSERNAGAANARAVPNSAAMAKIGTRRRRVAARRTAQNSTDVDAPRRRGRWRRRGGGRSGRPPSRSAAGAAARAGTRRGRAGRGRARCR